MANVFIFLGKGLKKFGRWITRTEEMTTVDVCLYESGRKKGPLDPDIIRLVYAMTVLPDGGTNLLNDVIAGDTVRIEIPLKFKKDESKYAISCMVDGDEVRVFAGVSVKNGNDKDTLYTIGRVQKQGSYYSNTWFKTTDEKSRSNQVFRLIMEKFFGISQNADDFYNQVLFAQEESTGQKFIRTQRYKDDTEDLHHVNETAAIEAQLEAMLDPTKINMNGENSVADYAVWMYEKNGIYKIVEFFIYNPKKIKEVIKHLYTKGRFTKEDATRIVMSFVKLFAKLTFDLATYCISLTNGKPEKDVSQKEAVRAILDSLGLFDKKSVDCALKDLFSGNKPKNEGNVDEVAKRYSGESKDDSEKTNGGGKKKAERTAYRDGRGGDPKMEEGRQVDFSIINELIDDIDADIESEDPRMTEELELRFNRAARALEEVIREAEKAGKQTVGAPYLNWKLKLANPDIEELRLLDGGLIGFKLEL